MKRLFCAAVALGILSGCSTYAIPNYSISAGTVANLRAHFNHGGGSLGTTGSVAFNFKHMGVFRLDPCDPYCVGFNEDAGLQAEGGAPSLYFNGTSIFGGVVRTSS